MGSALTQMLEWADENIKIGIITIFYISEKLSRDTKKTQIKLLEIKATMYEITNTLDKVNDRFYIGELEDITTETSSNWNR